MEADYDVIVAGAGPAGTACAITAARGGGRVLLLDKDSFPRHKVCGEFVSAESLGLLKSLLRAGAFAEVPELSSARVFLDGKELEIPVSPAARSIPRFHLDAALIRAARAEGVEVRDECTVREVEQAKTYRVITNSEAVTGTAVVNASGRWSRLTRFAPENGEKWIGLKTHFNEEMPPKSVDLYFFAGGYCGVQAVSDSAVNTCAMVRADVAATLEEVFRLHPELWARSRSWKQLFPAVATAALHFRDPRTEDRGMFLAGDSAAFIDPFAGDGISLALHSGCLAARSILAFLHGDCSLEQAHLQYEAAYRARLAPALRNAARLRRVLSAPGWIRSALMGIAGNQTVGKILVKSTRVRSA